MANKVISFRVPGDTHEALMEHFTSLGWTLNGGMAELVREYLQGELDVEGPKVETPRLERKQHEFFTMHGLQDDMFNLEYRPMQIWSDDITLDWLFVGEEYIQYEKNKHEINSDGWFLEMWVWTFIWSWWTCFGTDETIPTSKIFSWWLDSTSPVEACVMYAPTGKKDLPIIREIYSLFIEEKGEEW